MYEEGPYRFYLRATTNFVKSGDIEDAAEIYLSLLNIAKHDMRVRTHPAVTRAFHLLREEGIEPDVNSSGMLSKESSKGGRISDNRTKEKQRLADIENARLRAEKEGGTFRRHTMRGSPFRNVKPFWSPPGTVRPVRRGPTGSPENLDFTLRDYLESDVFYTAGEGSIAPSDIANYIPDDLIDALYSARPETGYLEGDKALTPHAEMVKDHPVNRIPLYQNNTFAAVMRDLYKTGGEVSEVDKGTRDWETKHSKHPHHNKFGKYDENSVGLEDLFNHGFDLWKKEYRGRFGAEGEQDDFVEHLILRNEGVPDERIFDECYDGKGSWDKDSSSRLSSSPWDGQSTRLGLIPKLLGLESLPPEEAKKILRWWVAADYNIDPGRNIEDPDASSFLAGQHNSRGLLNRVWEQRLQAMVTGPMTRPMLQSYQQFAPDYQGDVEEPDLDQSVWLTALANMRTGKYIEGTRTRDRTAGVTYLQQLADGRGILPNEDGAYGNTQPIIDEYLLNAWAQDDSIPFTVKQKSLLVKRKEKMSKMTAQDLKTRDAMSAHRSSLLPDGSPSFTDVYHRHNRGGGLSLTGGDVLGFFHDWLGGLMTDIPRSEEGSKAREVLFEGEVESTEPSDTLQGLMFPKQWQFDQMMDPLPILGEIKWEDERGVDWKTPDERGGAEIFDSGKTVDTRPFFSSLMPRDRSRLWDSETSGVSDAAMAGSGWYTDNPQNDFSWSPSKARAAQEHADWKHSRGGEEAREGRKKGRTTTGRLGDAAHISGGRDRRSHIAQSAMKHGNSYPHKASDDIGDPSKNLSLADLLFGLSNSHGDNHDLFDIARTKGIDSFLTHLITEANKLPTGEGSLPLSVQTNNAGITNYVKYQTPAQREKGEGETVEADGPLDRDRGVFTVYIDSETGTLGDDGENYIFHGLEPTGESNGNRMSVYRLMEEFVTGSNHNKQEWEYQPEDFVIRPHDTSLLYDALMMGSPKEVRERLDDDKWFKGVAQDEDFHQAVLESALRRHSDGLLHSEDLDRVMEKLPPEVDLEDPFSEWKTSGNMKQFDKYPILDPEARIWAEWANQHLRGLTEASPDPKDKDHTYHENFNKYKLRSPEFTNFYRLTAVGEQEVKVGEDMSMKYRLGEGPQPTEEELGNPGAIIAPHPVTLMRDHIARVEEYIEQKTEPGSMKRQVLLDALDIQKKYMVQYAYSKESGLISENDLFLGEHQAPDGFGNISSQFRHMLDSAELVGVVAQALKAHYIAEDPSLADKFGTDDEGYANQAGIFHAAERVIHSHDDSWREKLAKSMDKLGEERIASNLRHPRTRAHWSDPDYRVDEAVPEELSRMREAFSAHDAERVKGTDLLRYYIENGYMDDVGSVTKKYALDGLKRLEAAGSEKAFLDDIDKFVGERGEVHRGESGGISGISHKGPNRARTEYNALMQVASQLHSDSDITGSALSIDSPNRPLSIPDNFRSSKGPRGRSPNWRTYQGLGSLLGLYDYSPQSPSESRGIYERDHIGELEVGEDFQPASLFTSAGILSGHGTLTTPSYSYDHSAGDIPTIRENTQKEEVPLLHLPGNNIQHLMSDPSLEYDLYPTATGTETRTSDYWRGTPDSRTAVHTATAGNSLEEGLSDSGYTDLKYSLDVLTDVDLFLKGSDGKPIPTKPMHRIFELEDLTYLRGFSGDWIVSAWPKGKRLIVGKKGNTVRARDSDGQSVTLPNQVKKGLKDAYEKDYLLDCIWDMDVLHIVDILESGGEKIHDEGAKDRIRLLRAKFDATEEVSIPAPINTKRTDSEGLQQCVKDLLKERGVRRVLLRDAESTYMRGEARHPRWVLLSSKREIDVLVLSSKRDRHCLGVGPIPEGLAKKMGNRKQEYDDEWYMDVGSLTEAKVEEGQYITISFSSVTAQKRGNMMVYRVNASRYVGPSEASATDSTDTLKILSGSKEENIPHKVNVSKGSIFLTFPTGQVIYEVEPYGHGFILKDVDYPDDYTYRVAESQRDYWEPVAAVLLRSEKEEVVPEPPANHNKKPKKVLPKKVSILKDPELTKSHHLALEVVNELLKEKITWTGPKGLGIDYATPVQSPSGPTENTEGYNLPDHDPGHRQEKGGDCWCGAKEGQDCEQGLGQKMEDCTQAHPPLRRDKGPQHLQISHNSQQDSPA